MELDKRQNIFCFFSPINYFTLVRISKYLVLVTELFVPIFSFFFYYYYFEHNLLFRHGFPKSSKIYGRSQNGCCFGRDVRVRVGREKWETIYLFIFFFSMAEIFF